MPSCTLQSGWLIIDGGKSGQLAKLRLRAAMYLKYPLMRRCAGAGDVFEAVTNPFFATALAARAARKSGAKVVHLVYDLYPDALVFGGGWSPTHPAARFAAATPRRSIRECDATVYMGVRLRTYAGRSYGVAPRTAVIPVSTDASVLNGCEPVGRQQTGVRCLYSGHMGRLHDWITLAGGAWRRPPGRRALRDRLRRGGGQHVEGAAGQGGCAQPGEVEVCGHLGNGAWREAMLAADSDRPVAPRCVEELADAVRGMAKDPVWCRLLGQRGRACFSDNYNTAAVVGRLREVSAHWAVDRSAEAGREPTT
jgi:hypothetical protein